MNKKVFSLICAISCSLIWGSAFVAQDMGMDYNGPFTFTFGRLFLGFLTLIPFLFIFEYKKVNSIIFKKNMKKVKKMKYLGTTILKKTLNELDKSIHNEI